MTLAGRPLLPHWLFFAKNVYSLILSFPFLKTDIQDPVIKILKSNSQKYFWLTQVTRPNKPAPIILPLVFLYKQPFARGPCPSSFYPESDLCYLGKYSFLFPSVSPVSLLLILCFLPVSLISCPLSLLG